MDFILGARNKPNQGTREPLRWTSSRGDEWWCEDAMAGFGCGNFTIGSFGKFTAPLLAVELIHDALQAFPDATIDILLDSSTEPIVITLNERGLIASQQIELSPRTRVARVEGIRYGDSTAILNEKRPNNPMDRSGGSAAS